MNQAKNVRDAMVKIEPVKEPVLKSTEVKTQVIRQPTQAATAFNAPP